MNQTMLQGRLAIFRINYKSDFIITLNSDAGWTTPFCIKFWTGAPSQAYFAGWDGTTYTNCAPVAGEPTKLQVQFDDHHLPIGELKYQIGYHFTVADFPTTVEDEVLNQERVVVDHDGQNEKVLLDFNGETAPDIQFSLPAYANEAQRIANEEQRIAHEAIRIVNEEGRIAAEQTRQQNEEQRIAQETARVQEFALLKRESESATSDATAAATLANEKAQLAADKAALAQSAADLANAKAQLAADKAALAASAAQLANDKAALAQQKAEYAQTQGTYAKNQGDYAKQQGDYAKDQSDTALADHLRAEADHETAASDHTRAESDHSTASSDHTQASTDHSTATSDHSTAAADHTQAGTDHTRAEADHTRAESDHAAVEVYVDSLGAYDISAAHAVGGVLAIYASLQAALGNDGENIPELIRKGGMSVKFVQSSDNKYVQFRLMATSFSTDIDDWQGIDEEPIASSSNMAKSSGIAKQIFMQTKNIENSGYIEYAPDDVNYAFIRTTNWTVGYSRERLLYSIPINREGIQGKIKISVANGYKYYLFAYSEVYHDLKNGDTTDSSKLTYTTGGWVSTSQDLELPATTKTLVVTFSQNPDANLVKKELNPDTLSIKVLLNNKDIEKSYESLTHKIQFYNNENETAVVEESFSTSGSVYLHSTRWALRGTAANKNFVDNTAFAAELGVSLVTSPQGYQNCIEIPNEYCLVYQVSNNSFAIIDRANVTYDTLVLILCVSGRVRKLGYGMESNTILPRLTTLENKVGELGFDYKINNTTKCRDFATLFNNTTDDVESFLFFSDIHCYRDYNSPDMTPAGKNLLMQIFGYFNNTPTNFVLCGGDWLTRHKQSAAIKALANIDGYMNKFLGGNYFPIYGNHDNNYQGELDESAGTDANDGALSNQIMTNLWFRKWGKMYYTFKGTSTKFLVLDSGIDWVNTMDSYRWEQVDWFANELLSNTESHLVIAMHIVNWSGDEGFTDIAPMADNISKVAEAFNARTSITMNGHTYDFTNAQGKVHCILCGHTHYDYETTLNNVPVYCIGAALDGVFDLVLLNYGVGKLQSIRIGNGQNRVMNLAM